MLTITQLAARLGVTRQYVARLALAGRIPGAQRFGRAWMFADDAAVTAKLTRFRRLQQTPREP